MNYYEILGLTPDCETSQIKSAYRRLVRQFHPDINPNGANKFKDISNAYDTLIDPEKRKQYDILNGIFKSKKTDNNNEVKNKTEKSNSDKNFSKKQEKSQRKENKFTNVFNSFFENSNNNKMPINGENINADITINILEAIKGASKTVNIMHTELCPRCKGRKFINGTKCTVCSGSGEYTQRKRINVQIPKDIKNGSKLRLKGEGGEGLYGGENGDLFLNIKIEENPNIKYDGLNILYNIPITPYEAVLGGDIALPTSNGAIKLKLPERTTSGQKFRITGQGLTKNGKKGDIIVTVTIEIPKSLSDDEVKLYEKLRKISAKNIRENIIDG